VASDDYLACETALLEAHGQGIATVATGRPSRTMVPEHVPSPGMSYATAAKWREKGRVVEMITRVVFGTMAAVQAAFVVEGEPPGQHIVPGAAERHPPTSRYTVITSAGLCELSTNATAEGTGGGRHRRFRV
jgi:hypothetical protein